MKQNLKRFKDLDYACVLKFEGLDLLKVEWEGKTAYWVFNDPLNKADEVITKYVNKKLIGNISSFVETQKSLKKVMMNN